MSRQVGSRNQEGFVGSLARRGMTPNKAGSETLANSADAHSQTFTLQLPHHADPVKTIRGIDVGKGMTEGEFDNMFDAEREHHAQEQSMGVSGIGGILSSYTFAKDDHGQLQTTSIITKSNHGPYQQSIVPWGRIKETRQYDGNVTIQTPSNELIRQFQEDRPNGPPTGVTHMWPYSDAVANMCEEQFKAKPDIKIVPFADRWSLIFGKHPMKIILDRNDGTEPAILKKYDYMSGLEIDYYRGKTVYVIEAYEDERGNSYFVWCNQDEESYAIVKQGKGYSKEPAVITVQNTWRKHGELLLTVAMRKDPRIFDERNPKEPSSSELYLNDYDSEFFKEEGEKDAVKDYFSKIALIRNGQEITRWTPEGVNVGAARANANAMLQTIYLRAELSYRTASSQDNKMDEWMGIQQNKNQHQHSFPKNLERLLTYLKNMKMMEIKSYFHEVLANVPGRRRVRPTFPQPVPQPIPQPAQKPSPQPSPQPSPKVSPKPSPQPSPKVSPKPSPRPLEPSPQPSPRPLEPSQPVEPIASMAQESKDPSTEVLTSKQYYQQAARLLMEFSSRADFSETNGDQVLSMVQYLLS